MQLERIPDVTIPEEMIDALAYWSRDALFSLGGSDETVACVEIKPMADGSGHWAVFAHTYDRDGAEHSYRTIVDVAGETARSRNRSTGGSKRALSRLDSG